MADDLATIRDGARAHQAAIELAQHGLSVAALAQRWGLSETSVRDIPRAHLRYMEFGKGVRHKRRRYRLADVETYEAWKLAGEPGDPPFLRAA